MVRAILEAWSSLSQFSWSLRMYTMGMGLSRPSTMTPMFSTCPCTAMMMGTSSREVEHQMRYVECEIWGATGGTCQLRARCYSYLESRADAGHPRLPQK